MSNGERAKIREKEVREVSPEPDNANAGFAQFIYGSTNPLLAPFQGITATPSAGGSVFEISSLIAMLVYGLLAWIVVRAVWIVADRPA